MPAIIPLLQADDAVRIAHVRAPRWISHPAAGAAHDAMRLLLERPPSLRPRGLLLAGPYHNGKTMIAERFAIEHGVCSGWGQNDTLRPEITWFSICIRP